MKGKNLFVLLVCVNIILVASISYICYKTHFIHKVGIKLGFVEKEAVDSPDYWAIKGWDNTLKKLNLDVDIVFYGNSITCGSSFDKYFPNVAICNLGYPGDNLDGLTNRAYMISHVNPEKIFVMGGINGLKWMTDDVFKEKYKKMVTEIKRQNQTASIYLQSILPVNNSMFKKESYYGSNEKIARLNKIIKEIADESSCVYIDLYSLYVVNNELGAEYTKDGVHLKSEHYDIWANAIANYIYE